jgi:hypothetical protein
MRRRRLVVRIVRNGRKESGARRFRFGFHTGPLPVLTTSATRPRPVLAVEAVY